MQVISDLNTYIKPAAAAGSIFFIDKFITKQPNQQQTMYIAGGIGAGFLAAKLVSPYLPHLDLKLGAVGGFDSQAIEARLIEGVVVAGVLYGLQQAKVINLSSNKADIMTLAATILIADMLAEELPTFFGYHHSSTK